MKIHHAVLTVCFVLAGCTADVSLQGLTYEQKQQARQCRKHNPQSLKLQRHGSVAGCLSSLALTQLTGFKSSAALICSGGGLAGYLIGRSVAERRCEYITLERQLDGEIQHLLEMNQRFELLLLEQKANLKLLNDKVNLLKQKQQLAQRKPQSDKDRTLIQTKEEDLSEQNSLLEHTVNRLDEERYMLDQLEIEQTFTQETLTQATQQGYSITESDRKNRLNILRRNIALLKRNTKKLDKNNDALLKVNAVLMAMCHCQK